MKGGLGRSFAAQKVEATLHLLEEISSIEFPHDDSTQALAELKVILEDVLSDLETAKRLPLETGLLRSTQLSSLEKVINALDLAGLVANSANIRNAFEGHGPLLDIARRLVGSDAHLVLSFQWEWVPFTYPQTSILSNYIIIGLPASEASNALVLPAVGHELGHSLWRKEGLDSTLQANVRERIIEKITGEFWQKFKKLHPHAKKGNIGDMVNQITWLPAFRWTIRQTEELFCDFIGLFIFGSSYLDCMAYLLSPVFSEARPCEYPSMQQRARYLEEAAAHLGVSVPNQFSTQFDEEGMHTLLENEQLLLSIADKIVSDISRDIRARAFDLCRQRLGSFGDDNHEALKTCFEHYIPGETANNLRSILVAGWETFKSPQFLPDEKDLFRATSLNQLIFKTMEIFEIKRIP